MDIQPAHAWSPSASVAGGASATIQAEAGVRETCDRVAAAWTSGDAAALSAVLAPDCDHLTLTRVRHVKRGRRALMESWDEAFAKRGAAFNVRMKVVPQHVRLLQDDLALVDGTFEYSDGIGALDIHQGRASQPFTAVMAYDHIDWVILALRVGPSTAAAKVVPCSDEASASA